MLEQLNVQSKLEHLKSKIQAKIECLNFQVKPECLNVQSKLECLKIQSKLEHIAKMERLQVQSILSI